MPMSRRKRSKMVVHYVLARMSLLRWSIVRDDRGGSLIEYVLVLALIVGVAIGAITLFGSATSNMINNSAHNLARP